MIKEKYFVREIYAPGSYYKMVFLTLRNISILTNDVSESEIDAKQPFQAQAML